MAHHVYHTEAIVVGMRAQGEGDRLLELLTPLHGLIYAHAKSIREARSRLRYGLQLFAHARTDLVRGRSGWKLISATPVSTNFESWKTPHKRRILAGHAQLLRRLVQGEEEHAALFAHVRDGYLFIRDIGDEELLRDAEILLTVRLLARLGYWSLEDSLTPYATAPSHLRDDLAFVRPHRTLLLTRINSALHSSQL
jgi:recombinational DNA repair protein (RecF pathway)